MKKVLAIVLCLVMVFALAACGNNGGKQGEAEKPIVIRVAYPPTNESAFGQSVLYWEEQVQKLVPGKVEFENYPNGTLASERESGEMMMDGTLACAYVAPANVNAFAPVHAGRMEDMPFLFKDTDEILDALDEWLKEEIKADVAQYGFQPVFFSYVMCQEIENSKRPITDQASVKGLKIRVYDSAGPYNFLEANGGLPVAMAFSEVYTAIQQGAVDGVFTTTSNFVPQKFVEVCKYHSKLAITNLGMCMWIGDDFFYSYPKDVQDAILKAGELHDKWCKETLGPKTREETYGQIEAAGVKINEVSEADAAIMIQATKDYAYDKLRQEIGAALWDKTVAWCEKHRAGK